MPDLYGPKGEAIDFAKKPKKALTGELVTSWGDSNGPISCMPSAMNLSFDTSRLTIADYRVMREHPQIAASLAMLSFMMYQRDWHITGDRDKEVKHCTENMKMLWGRVPRAMSSAYWAGHAPCALNWENDISKGRLWITKIKDLKPENTMVKWKRVKGVADDKGRATLSREVPIYDGIKQPGYPDIPVANSFWYPLLMESGNYYGRKLLNAAFQPWYFSMVMHMYSNRYMERFAEPTPMGRAPYDEKIKVGGQEWSGNKLMGTLLDLQRSGSGVVLPNSRSQDGLSGDSTYDYTMEFMESQLRGVEFDRVIRMYDEEISMALFTPLLLMRNGDVGSSNLGVVHTQSWMLMLNALGNDQEEYINKYLIAPMALQNFGPNAKIPRFQFRPLGKMDAETLRSVIQTMMAKDWEPDIEEVGAAAGLTFKEVQQILPDPKENPNPLAPDPAAGPVNPDGSKKDPRVGRPGKNKTPTGTDKVTKKVIARIADQATKAFETGTFGVSWEPDFGYRKQFTDEMIESGMTEWSAGELYADAVSAVTAMAARSVGTFGSAAEFVSVSESVIDSIVEAGVHEAQNAA